MILNVFQAVIIQVPHKEGRSHLVAIANIIEGPFSPLFIFDDFSVQNISVLTLCWKMEGTTTVQCTETTGCTMA